MSKTLLSVEGMSCTSCIDHISEALSIRGVSKIYVQFAQGSVEVEHDPTVSVGRLIAVLKNAGYEAASQPRS